VFISDKKPQYILKLCGKKSDMKTEEFVHKYV